MDLLGVAFANMDPPLGAAYLSLSDLTVVIGPNDVGKSRLLSLIDRHLSYSDQQTLDDLPAPFSLAFIVRLTPGEELLIREYGSGEQSEEDEMDAEPELAGAGVLEQTLAHLGTDGDVRDRIFDLITERRLFALEPANDGRWRLSWCLPARSQLDPAVVEALAGAGLDPDAPAADDDDGRAYWLHPSAPIPVAVMLEIDASVQPRSVFVPGDMDRLLERLEDAIGMAATALRVWGGTDDVYDPGLVGDDRDSWLLADSTGYGVNVDAHVIRICEQVSMALEQAVPEFVTERYRIVMRINPVVAWETMGRSRIELRGDDDATFDATALAAGFRVWLELAIYEVLARIERNTLVVRYLTYTRSHDELGDDALALIDADMALGEYSETAELELTGTDDRLSPVIDWLAEHVQELDASDVPSIFALLRPRLFLLDEPERHLHPTLARRAADWLVDRMATGEGQAVIVSHSPAFLSVRGHVRFVYVHRTPVGSALREFDPATLTVLDAIAADMGFDRGELLAGLRAVLYVEGVTDRVVIETLYGNELRMAGVAVSAFGGTRNLREVLSDPLILYTSAKIAVLVDAMPMPEVRRLVDDRDHRRSVIRLGKGEAQALARLIGAAEREGKTVNPYGLKGLDIFDLLDDKALREVSDRWPGHEAARRAWDEEVARRGRVSGDARKAFYRERFGVSVDAQTCRRAAASMAARGRQPPELTGIIAAVSNL